MYPRLGTSVLERQYSHFRPSAFLFSLVKWEMLPCNWISRGASYQLHPALGILKDLSVTDTRAMLIPERSQNHSLTKFVLDGKVHRVTFFLLLCFHCHVASSTCIISAV